ncbi:MAG: hypothetical protein ACKVQW_06260 [Pyrinomonadaceae bacterium]
MTLTFAAVAFLVVLLAIAFVAFKMLKKTVKMAVRIAIVAVIIAVALAGSAYFLLTDSSKSTPKPKPANTR